VQRRKKAISSDDEDEAESESVSLASANQSQKRSGDSNGLVPVTAILCRSRLLSSSSEGTPSASSPAAVWLGKPRLAHQPTGDKLRDRPLTKRRAVFESSSSSSSEDDLMVIAPKTNGDRRRHAPERSPEDTRKNITELHTLKGVKAKLRNERLSRAVVGEDDDDLIELSETSDREYTPDDEDKASRSSRSPAPLFELPPKPPRKRFSQSELKQQCVQFFNEAGTDELLTAPKCSAKAVEYIQSVRPFDDYDDLVSLFIFVTMVYMDVSNSAREIVRRKVARSERVHSFGLRGLLVESKRPGEHSRRLQAPDARHRRCSRQTARRSTDSPANLVSRAVSQPL
jgi:hypothetical protein